jgi:hypothetical protein
LLEGSGRPRRASGDPQQGHHRWQPRPCRPRFGIAGLHAGADATIVVRGQDGERRIAAADFFTGIYETALSPQELLVAVEVPVAPKNSAHFFCEFARRHGDYAIVGLAAQAMVESEASAIFGWPSLQSAIGRCMAKAPREADRCRDHARGAVGCLDGAWAKNSIPRKISRRPARCAGISPKCCWRVASPRCCPAPIFRFWEGLHDGADAHLA